MRTGRAIRKRCVALVLYTISLLTLVATLSVNMLYPQETKAADLSDTYTWKQLKIGGGGFVTGIAIHPTTSGLAYIRTDVGGAYRWNASTEIWTQLLTVNSVSTPNTGDYNVESIAVSKSNDQVVYLAAGTTWDIHNNPPTGRILKSTNRGTTWTDSGQRWPMNGNAEYRQGAEHLAVDPNNGNVVYFGSRTQGLWVSMDGADHWSQVSTSQIPIGSNSDANNPVGVKFVVFDPNSGTTGGKTNRIYAGVAGNGIYMSNDAGASWTKILADSNVPFSTSLGADGTFYTVILGNTSVQKYTPSSNTWTNITPNGNSSEIAVDPFNAQRIFVISGGGQIWRSTDGGVHWDAPGITVASSDIPWIVNTDEKNYMSSAKILFDPVTPDTLWFPQGTGVWQATNLGDSTINWVFKSKGIEETVTSDLIAPPGGKPVSAILDRNGFYHSDPDTYPLEPNLTEYFSAGLSLDYSGETPSFLAAVSTDTRGLTPDQSGYSTDGGQPYPAVYMHGMVNDKVGIWRSVDQGVSWDLAAEYPLGIYDTVSVVTGDMNIAGRVYVGFGGNGFAYGDSDTGGTVGTPLPTPTPIPTQQINVAQVTSAPTIDGNGDDAIWSNAASSSLTRPIGSPSSDFASSFQTAWDTNNLYFLVKTTDALLSRHTDLVEIYLDPNHSRGTTYDSQDMQYQFLSNSTTPAQWNGGTQGTNTTGVTQANQTTSIGYQTEIAIPWARLGITTPSANTVLGLDLSIWQDSGSGVKKKLSWNTTADNAWTNPSVFGIATLQGAGGIGLKGDYYNSTDLSGSVVLSRTDATVNFDWGNGSPGAGVNTDTFSVRWTGQVQATNRGNYTFSTISDDGVCLWVNGQQMINNWADHPPTIDNSASITLNARQKYTITMELYERGSGAVAKLLWTPPDSSQQAIPQSQLYS